jgi:aldehyde:ferredoxin oxidoreductase
MEKKISWRILRANLTERTIDHEEIDGETLLLYMGGSGIGSKILYEETSEATDPLGPENRLIFMTGLFTGSSVPASGRHSIISKSPLTNIYGESDIGGSWGVTLKGAGYDGVVITGKSEDPIYLLITGHGIEIKDAKQLWGKDSYETDYLVKKEIGPKSAVMCIGQSGEKLSRISSIMSDGSHGRAAGRCGFGAVMGSKKLKAIAVLGERQIRGKFQNDRSLKESVSNLLQTIKEKGKPLSEYGTAGQILNAEETGDLPIKNWIAGSWGQGAQKISGQRMSEQILSGRYSCRGCIIGCGRVVDLFDDRFGKVSGGGPEYETLAAFGSMCLVDDLPVIAKANEICNRYGIDTVSTGNIIAFAMEAYENKLILKEDLDNMELEWGNSNALLELVTKIGKREGIGELLSEGIRISAEKIGQGSKDFAMHVKGLELPMHDPRAFSSLAVAYATSRIGASHWAATHSLESRRPMPDLGYPKILDRFESKGKGIMTAKMQDYMEMFESLKICKFISWVPLSSILDWIYYLTGTRMEPKEFMMTGERISNLKRMYNVRHGITRKDDNLPERIMTQKRGEGAASDHLPNLELMLDEYYLCRDWDKNGIPRMDKLKNLDLEKLVEIKTS